MTIKFWHNTGGGTFFVSVIITKKIKTPYGELVAGSIDGKICLCDWKYRKMRQGIDRRIQRGFSAAYKEGDSSVLDELERQFTEYFSGQRKMFDLPLLTVGTDFQKRVWDALIKIPYGETETYQGLADRINQKSAVRAVASANGANALAIIIPCHRIIGANNTLGGYAGGLDVKRRLLQLESKNSEGEVSSLRQQVY